MSPSPFTFAYQLLAISHTIQRRGTALKVEISYFSYRTIPALNTRAFAMLAAAFLLFDITDISIKAKVAEEVKHFQNSTWIVKKLYKILLRNSLELQLAHENFIRQNSPRAWLRYQTPKSSSKTFIAKHREHFHNFPLEQAESKLWKVEREPINFN